MDITIGVRRDKKSKFKDLELILIKGDGGEECGGKMVQTFKNKQWDIICEKCKRLLNIMEEGDIERMILEVARDGKERKFGVYGSTVTAVLIE